MPSHQSQNSIVRIRRSYSRRDGTPYIIKWYLYIEKILCYIGLFIVGEGLQYGRFKIQVA